MADTPAPSPLAPPGGFPDLPDVGGVRLAAVEAGVRYQGRADVMLASLTPGTEIAGVFTQSKTRAAPVIDCAAKLDGPAEEGAAFIVNAGNANAFTGKDGLEAVERIAGKVAEAMSLKSARVFTASTGVIGEELPDERITGAIDRLVEGLQTGAFATAAQAIMTTDTFPKGSGRVVEIDGQKVSIAGIAKGSGMIAPDMATMLVFIFTDGAGAKGALQNMLSELCETTFNAITVDSDTSTSDTLLLAATGTSGVDVSEHPDFRAALGDVMADLAHQVVRDGEGATKFVRVHVTGAKDKADAKRVAMAIANSPLVKTAIAGEDPNWGRVVMAVGKSGAEADRDRLSIKFGSVEVAYLGKVAPGYSEAAAATHMKGDEIDLSVDLGLGSGAFTAYTCDLTHGYISINADYRS
ncbi:MAG: bifunctional glutamate N-acetyltransferase/amino-acid acetyltransferase ArgJ [Pseudomonadota bacterium]